MIIPINNGRTITPIYIPQPVVTTSPGVLEQSNANLQNTEPTLASWIAVGVVLIFLIAVVVYFIKSLKDFFGGEE
jgi:hypothetical protein